MSLSYDGIGASLQLDDDYVKVMNILPGGSAADSTRSRSTTASRPSAKAVGTAGRRDRLASRRRRADDSRAGNTVVRLQILPAGASPGSPESS